MEQALFRKEIELKNGNLIKEIESLQAEMESLKEDYGFVIEDLRAEIKRLRGGLDMVIDYLNHPDPWEFKSRVKDTIIGVLKEALNGQIEEKKG